MATISCKKQADWTPGLTLCSHWGYVHAGYALNFAKMTADWGKDHSPAYFVATNNEQRELLVCIRGTRQVEDVLADITAFPVVSWHRPVHLSAVCSGASHRDTTQASPVVCKAQMSLLQNVNTVPAWP